MVMKTMNESELVNLFAKLGARNPAKWARSQLDEKIPQLARFLFLREAWKLVVPENDHHWISAYAEMNPMGSRSPIESAIERVMGQGVRREDLTTIVRVMQLRLLFGLCYLLDDPGDLEDDVKSVWWRLFQVDERGEPVAAIAGLHESVGETEPKAVTRAATKFVYLLVERIPALTPIFKEHVENNDEVLPHVFFGELTRWTLSLLEPTTGEIALQRTHDLRDILETLETTYAGGDDELQDLISVSFPEHLPRPGAQGSEIRQMLGPSLSKQLEIVG